jgi:hypothetical protein
MTNPPRPPGDLKQSGRALWRKLTAAYVLDERESEVLARACRLADLERALMAGLETSGVVTTEGKTPPAVARLLATQNLLCRLLASLDLPGADGVRTPTSMRAGNAGAARWRHHNEVAAKRKELRRG